uniref:non-specific serine/threonine protein kinase n=1 Tax=Haptolina ericina TaxID=156174 RepID=A0A7S3AU83_9EUKA
MHLVERETRSQGMAAEHPNVLGLVAHECVSTANADVVQARLLFPLCEGGTLADFLKAEGGIPTDEMLRIFSQLASAVAHCHAVGVIHRDIKLTNVYRDGEGRWLLADFGSALSSTATIELDTREALALARHEVETLTTPEYRSPEQVSLELRSKLTPAVDVWALGVALYQMTFNANPFATPLQTLSERTPHPNESSTPPRLISLIESLLNKDVPSRCTAAQAVQLVDSLQLGGNVRV